MDIEEDIKILEGIIEEYKNCSVPGLNMLVDIGFREKQCNALEHIISDYKKLQEEFKDVDHECSRLEQKELRLEKENQKLKQDISHMYDEDVIINIMCDEFNISKSEALELLGEEE